MSSSNLATGRRPRRRVARALATLTLAGCAVALGGCGAVEVQPTAASGSAKLASRGQVDSPLTDTRNHLGCMLSAHLAVRELSPTKLQIDAPPAGPTVVFTPTPGAAQAAQLDGEAQSAEVIGSALVYPNQGSDAELTAIEDCLSQGVQG